jgi:hypothetical protein
MANRRLRLCILVCGFMCLTATVGSQAQSDEAILSSFPVVPMNVRFRFVPQYFVQRIDDDPKYSRIEALIDDGLSKPWYEIILADKTTGDRIIYSNSEETVNTLRGVGKTAYRSNIRFEFLPQKDSISMYQIGLRDISGQEINWKFVVNPTTTRVQAGFMIRPNTSGFVLMGLDQRAAAMPGTTLIIGNVHYSVTSMQESNDGQLEVANSGTFYGTGLTVAEIMPGVELWLLDSLPDTLKADEKWILHSSGGEKRVLTIESVRDNHVVIDQVDQDRSLHVRLDVRRLHDSLLLSSISVMRQSHDFRVSFMPELPFPAAGLNDATKVNFVVSEDSQTDIAHGSLLARRRFIDENIDWDFDAPDWARARLMETGASVLIESEISRGKPVK